MTTIITKWQLWEYDVWGNKEDGYQVNDRFKVGEVEIKLKTVIDNINTPFQFVSASVSDWKIKQLFGVSCKIDVDGDDTSYYIERSSDNYPIGEMFCISHQSLSPISQL